MCPNEDTPPLTKREGCASKRYEDRQGRWAIQPPRRRLAAEPPERRLPPERALGAGRLEPERALGAGRDAPPDRALGAGASIASRAGPGCGAGAAPPSGLWARAPDGRSRRNGPVAGTGWLRYGSEAPGVPEAPLDRIHPVCQRPTVGWAWSPGRWADRWIARSAEPGSPGCGTA